MQYSNNLVPNQLAFRGENLDQSDNDDHCDRNGNKNLSYSLSMLFDRLVIRESRSNDNFTSGYSRTFKQSHSKVVAKTQVTWLGFTHPGKSKKISQ
jgi:hypothetical protein